MQRLQKTKKNYTVPLIAAGIVFAVAAFMLLYLNRSHPKDLLGTWVYDSNTEYDFDGKRAGVMHAGGEDFAFSYRTKGSKLTLEFEDAAVETACYRFRINDNVLILAGEEGTTGGVYQLVLLP